MRFPLDGGGNLLVKQGLEGIDLVRIDLEFGHADKALIQHHTTALMSGSPAK
jgi:hypothetical protein